jgi:dynein heavy chain 2
MLNVLHNAVGKMGTPIVRHVMNPKALERSKLLGKMDPDTREWQDGVLTAAARQVQREPAGVHTWVVCDGDVDPEWIESLNSVLDDNHLLTMPNGERIKFGSNVNFVFETSDLSHASPATVSRMGMIFLSEVKNDEVKALVTSWIKKQDSKLQARIAEWLEAMFYAAMDWVIEAEADVVARTKVGLVLTGLSHLRGVSAKGEFCCALIRGLGCNLPMDKRAQFATKVWQMSGSEKPLDSRNPLDTYFNKSTGSLAAYSLKDSAISMDSISFRSPPVVQTIDVQRNRDMILPWLQDLQPFILVGPEGAGKTLLLEDAFKTLKHCMVTTIHCSAQTNASHVLQKLNDNCSVFSTNKGRVYRPKEGERLILFLKDLNLPRPDKYDTIQLIAFLQQLITFKGFYDDALDWISIEKIQIVCAMNTTSARHSLSTRFTATVHVAYMTYPDREQLVAIYTNFLKGVLTCVGNSLPDPTWRSEGNIRKLCGTMVEVYEKVRAKFSVDDHRHYLFNPRDLTQWVFGLLRYDLAKENLLDVLMYEGFRLFSDRLVTPEALKAFEAILYGLMNAHWKHGTKIQDMYFTSLQQYSLDAPGGGGADSSSSKPDISILGRELGSSLDRVSSASFKDLCTEGMMTYEREYKNLNMLLFPEILDHIALEDRVLSRPGGSLFLVGDSGVGRRTSITLVCHMLRITLFSPHMSRKYDSKAFRTDLKEWLKLAGVDGKQVLLYVEDHQLVDPTIIEDINSLLSAGEVAGLYTPQELEPLLQPLREAFNASGTSQVKQCGEEFCV